MQTIAIQRGLETIKADLEKMGYHIVYYDEVRTPVDALIYLEETNTQSLRSISQMLNTPFMSENISQQNRQATLLINAKGKNSLEIKEIIDKKLYSPLF